METFDKQGTSKSVCLAVSPTRADLAIVFEHGILPAIEDSRHFCIRAKSIYERGDNLNEVAHDIRQVGTVVADLTGRDPNVLFQVGWALAAGKRLILLSQNAADAPNDLQDQVTFIPYSFSSSGAQKLQNDIRLALSSPSAGNSSYSGSYTSDFEIMPRERTIVYEELRGGDTIRGVVVSTGPLFAVIQDEKRRCFRLYNTDVSWFYKEENMAYQFPEGSSIQATYIGEDNHGNLKISLKESDENPWPELLERYVIGDTITGSVKWRDARRYGVEIDDEGTIGLLPISEIKTQDVSDGSQFSAQIRAISEETGIILGIGEDPWNDIDFDEGEIIEGKVVKVLPYGLLVELSPGAVGLWHASNGCTEPDTYVEEQVVEVKIKEIDRTRRKIYLCNAD